MTTYPTRASQRVLDLRHLQAQCLDDADTFQRLAAEVHQHPIGEPLVECTYRLAVARGYQHLSDVAHDAAADANALAVDHELHSGSWCEVPCRPHDHDECVEIRAQWQHRGVA